MIKLLIAGLVCTVLPAYSSVLFSEDFDGQVPGNAPTGANRVSPSTPDVNDFIIVVSGSTNTAGTGEGVQLYDNDTGSGLGLEYNFVASVGAQISMMHLSFDFAYVAVPPTGSHQVFLGGGKYGGFFASGASRYFASDFKANGTVEGEDVSDGLSHHMDVMVNDSDTEILSYTDPNGLSAMLQTNSVAFWIDGTHNHDELMLPITFGTLNNFGRFGFTTLTSSDGVSYIFDNLVVSKLSNIPAPITLFEEDFEVGQTLGNSPQGAAAVSPAIPENDIFIKVVGGTTNTAGTGFGVQSFDNDTVIRSALEYDFVESAIAQISTLQLSFDFAYVAVNPTDPYQLFLGGGKYGGGFSSGASRYFSSNFEANGTVEGVDVSDGFSHHMDVIVNDSDTEILDYIDPNGLHATLQTNSVAFWIDQTHDHDELMSTVTFGTVDNFGRFGFNSLTSTDGVSYIFDNFAVYELNRETHTAPQFVVNSIFHDNMMLQRDLNAPIWGIAPTGSVIEVYLDDVLAGSVITGLNSNWLLRLPPQANDGGISHILKIESLAGSTITIENVIFGDVYLCSGQSNMEFKMGSVIGFAETFSSDNNSKIRHIDIGRNTSSTELDEVIIDHKWVETSPSSVSEFTAVGYLFARKVFEKTNVPIGLLNSSYGGRPINRYLSPEGVKSVPELAGFLAEYEQSNGASTLYEIYNAMIHPLVPYGIKGFLWYQGETDRSAPVLYESKMIALIRGWRSVFGYGNLPFYSVQLPNFSKASYSSTENYPLIRDAQLRTLSETNTGMAVTIDVGDNEDIHPTNKQDPASRLAQWALTKDYGMNQVFSSPLFLEVREEGSQIRVLFDHADGGLMVGTKDGTNSVVKVLEPLENFEVAGADRIFVDAIAVIDADTVLVSAPSVVNPEYVRYCYTNAPAGAKKLYNQAELPASPFRSDDAYELKVVSGTGSVKSVVPGNNITITASSAPVGMVFDRWIGGGDSLALVNNASTTVVMPLRDLYILASFRSSSATSYSLTVAGGTGDGFSKEGGLLEVKADAALAEQVFDRWVGDTQTVFDVHSESTMLRMPASNVVISASYDSIGTPIVPSTKLEQFTVEVDLVSMEFSADVGFRYELVSTTNLVTGGWQTAIYNIKGDGFSKQLVIPTQDEKEVFYRVLVK